MKYLLDTHAVLWMATNSPKLSEAAKQVIFDSKNESFVSIVSAWEVAIKTNIGKMRLNGGISEFFNIIYKNGLNLLPITEEYIKQLEKLPLLHRDPFDRILVASAMSERMSLVTADENIRLYDSPCVW